MTKYKVKSEYAGKGIVINMEGGKEPGVPYFIEIDKAPENQLKYLYEAISHPFIEKIEQTEKTKKE
jgi:hypothetical protein